MTTIRKTLTWMFLLLLAGAAVGGGYAWYFWNRSDELLEQALLERLHEIAPEWDVKVRGVRPDFHGRIRVDEFTLNGSDGRPLLATEVILTVDPEHLADSQTTVRSIILRRPHVYLARDTEGLWNFQKLHPLSPPRGTTPEFHIEQMELEVTAEGPQPGEETAVHFEDVGLQFIPSGARQFLVKGTAKFSGTDGISAEGTWDVEAGTWSLGGQIKNVSIDGTLSKLAAEFSPDSRAGLARLGALLDSFEARGGPAATALGASHAARAGGGAVDPLKRLGLSAMADLRVRATKWRAGAECEYKISLALRNGEIKQPPVPFPLSEIQGNLWIENHQIVVKDLSARSGGTRVVVKQGRVLDRDGLHPAECDLEVTHLPLDERIPDLGPPLMRKVYSEVRPGGEVDLICRLEFDGIDAWRHEIDLYARNCTVRHERFPYLIEQIEGRISRRGALVDLELNGKAGSQSVTLTGRVTNPGPEAECLLVVKAARIPIDDRLYSACPPKFQAVIDRLQARGELDGTVWLKRPKGLGQPLAVIIDASVRNGSVNCQSFAYPFSGVSGKFGGSGENWQFSDFKGRHGAAEVFCNGRIAPDARDKIELELAFSVVGAAFDRELYEALQPDCRGIWNEFNPKGGLNAAGTLLWNAVEPDSIRLNGVDVELYDASFMLRSFPFSIVDVAGKAHVEGNVVTITNFSGRHEEMTLRVESGRARVEPDGEWRVRLEKMFVDDLEATPQFRRALPKSLLAIVDALNPRGKQSISGMLEFRGKRGEEYPITAAWETETCYAGTTLTAGVDLRDIYGKAFFSGIWDGEAAYGQGEIDLRTAKILKHQLTDIQGPVRLRGNRLELGAPMRAARGPAAGEGSRRLTARFIEGLVSLDAEVDIDRMAYHVHTTLEQGNLKRYAQLYMNGNQKLAGTMNGTIDLKGEGTDPRGLNGSGQLVIGQAALYELPVIIQILNVLGLQQPDKKAFDQAQFVFDIGGGAFHFGHIRLVGDSLTLDGRGIVNFDGNVQMGFFSRTGRRQIPIPVVREIVNVATKGAVGVEVTGTLQAPKTQMVPFPQLDEALRRLLQTRDGRSAQRPR